MEQRDLANLGAEEDKELAKKPYTKPEIKKYPVIQQTTGYVIYYYVS